MHLITIQTGELQVSKDVEAILATNSLGSRIAVTLYDPVAQIGGLMLVQLPEPGGDPESGPHRLYADTGAIKLLAETCRQGAQKQRLIVTIAGGGPPPAESASLNWGKKNYLAVRKSLWKLGVMLQGETVGGTAPQCVRLEVATGKYWLVGLDHAVSELVLT